MTQANVFLWSLDNTDTSPFLYLMGRVIITIGDWGQGRSSHAPLGAVGRKTPEWRQ